MSERRWLVWADETPQVPNRQLTLDEAIVAFRDYVEDDTEEKVEIRQVDPQDLIPLDVPDAPPVASTPDTELRERYARAIARAMWGAAANRDNPMPIDWSAADAVMAERDTEVERLTGELAERTRERDLAVAHDRQPYPTAWAYEQACAVLHRKEAELAALRAGRDLALWLHAEQTWRYNVVLRDCAEAQTAEDVAIEEGRGYLTRSRELASQLAALRAQQQDMVRLPADARGEIERLLAANVGKPAGGVAHKVMLLLTDDWCASPTSTEDQALCVLTEANDMEAFAALPECETCGGTGKNVPEGWWEGQDAAAERQRE